MKSIFQHIELASHIAIIIVAILISVILVKTYLLPDSNSKAVTNNGAPQMSNAVVSNMLGQKIDLPNIDWRKNGQTLVLALQTGCHFCTESAPFYKELIQKRAKEGKTHLIAVLPDPVDASKNYLSNLGIVVDDVKQMQLTTIGVQGTPTLLLINKDGIVINAWRGKLAADKEREVMAHL